MYEKPALRELGTFAELTLDTIHKDVSGTDTIIYSDGTVSTIPGTNPMIS